MTSLSLSLCACRAVRYRRRYLRQLDFDNIYITSELEDLDRQAAEASGGGASVLPLTRREARTYISPRQSDSAAVGGGVGGA